jgi:virulence factor Mce-like protein
MRRRRGPSPTAVGAVTLLLTAIVITAILTGLARKPFESGGRSVYADFVRAPQLHKGDQVRIDGHIEGRVAGVTTLAQGRGVRAKLTVKDGAGPIFADARAHLRAKTLLAGAFFVDLERGSARSGELGSMPIPRSRTTVQVEIEDVTDIFRAGAVSGLRALPRELGDALEDPAAPTRALDALNRHAGELRGGLDALRGRDAGRDLPAVVANVNRAVRALDSPTDEIGTLVSGAAATLQTTANRGDELRSIIHQAPQATSGLQRTLARLDTTLDIAHRLVDRVRGPAPDVAPTLARLQPAVTSTSDLLVRARPLLHALRPALRSLADTATDGVPLLDGLRGSLARTDEQILPELGTKDRRTGKSTSVMIGGFAAGFGGIASQQDQNGHFIRFPFSLTSNTLHLPCSSSLIDADAASLVACDSLSTAFKTYLSYFPIGGGPVKKARHR